MGNGGKRFRHYFRGDGEDTIYWKILEFSQEDLIQKTHNFI